MDAISILNATLTSPAALLCLIHLPHSSTMNTHPHVRTCSIQVQWLYTNVPQHPCHDQDACDSPSILILWQALVSPSLASDLFGAPFSMHACIPAWSAVLYTDEHEPLVGRRGFFFSYKSNTPVCSECKDRLASTARIVSELKAIVPVKSNFFLQFW